jgi:hypothetical protein
MTKLENNPRKGLEVLLQALFLRALKKFYG